MIQISLCMIVKNEERVLNRCLKSIADLMDEIIIVDTGSTDQTKEIARKYTENIYDFEWKDDFSAARNFAFSKATKDYIYSADADEVMDEENRKKFRDLKEVLLPEIEIVQMRYCNQLSHGTSYNFDAEYRPKLYKRLRGLVWIEPVHEMVRLDPVVYDSDIDIRHMPEEVHSGRDFKVFQRYIREGGASVKTPAPHVCYGAGDFGHGCGCAGSGGVFRGLGSRPVAKHRRGKGSGVHCRPRGEVAGRQPRYFENVFKGFVVGRFF